ncbi:uncharacterized protein LOC142563224 [Dermacentor variabilis]|uniref:uncharacterized protein LOC142563224 n=1 Tax=Dermacentor variabilis TaxID=34621 RepID=UPI003F5BC894
MTDVQRNLSLEYAASGITNLRLLAAADRYITVGWDKPTANFDFYLLDVTCRSGNDSLKECHTGSCGNGTIIPADQTQVTCGPFEACSRISVTVRTFSRGPPERTSVGTTLNDVFTPGQGPSEPKNITIHGAPSIYGTKIQWEAPKRVHGILDVYKVKVCEFFSICDQMQGLGSCLERSTSDAWVDFESTEDTPYCVLITASARCGAGVRTSAAAMQEIRTPVIEEL